MVDVVAAGVVLVGGRSARMGSLKRDLKWMDKTTYAVVWAIVG